MGPVFDDQTSDASEMGHVVGDEDETISERRGCHSQVKILDQTTLSSQLCFHLAEGAGNLRIHTKNLHPASEVIYRPVMSSAVEEPLTDEEVIALLKADGLITDPAPMVREAAAEWEALSPEARPLVSVPAMYDGEHIALLGAPPSREPYRVLVTFVEPVSDVGAPRLDLARFWASFGAWRDDRPTGEILADIDDARRSRPEPPAL